MTARPSRGFRDDVTHWLLFFIFQLQTPITLRTYSSCVPWLVRASSSPSMMSFKLCLFKLHRAASYGSRPFSSQTGLPAEITTQMEDALYVYKYERNFPSFSFFIFILRGEKNMFQSLLNNNFPKATKVTASQSWANKKISKKSRGFFFLMPKDRTARQPILKVVVYVPWR